MVYVVRREPTSINVIPELWRDAKMEALKRGTTVTNLFEQALSKEIGKDLRTYSISNKSTAKIRGER